MVPRPFWVQRIEAAWREAPVVWLAGVRRSGKTVLARGLGDDRIVYVNCDLPATEDRVADPERFYRDCDRSIVVFDEVHRLKDPSRLLKIGADGFPRLRILATGSSTLAATRKFSDTLTGRKRLVHLTPVLLDEIEAFGRGWDPLRPDDLGVLWEHVVLEYLLAHEPGRRVHHWRDTAGREVDFVLPRTREAVDAMECKWDPSRLDAAGLRAFRTLHRRGTNVLMCPCDGPPYRKKVDGIEIWITSPEAWWGTAAGGK